MKSYTPPEARQDLATLLDEARREGAVRIEQGDGQSFVLTPEPQATSPLDIPGITPSTPITCEDILQSIEESRERYG